MEIYNDFNTSVEKALSEIDENWKSYDGLIICGTHNPHDVEALIAKIKEARETGKPALLICAGHQLGAVEYARNVLGVENAMSEEWGILGQFIVIKRPEGLKVGLYEGESYWNNYEVVESFDSIWEKAPNFITVQYHPEYQSSLDRPHPDLIKFLNLCRRQ